MKRVLTKKIHNIIVSQTFLGRFFFAHSFYPALRRLYEMTLNII